MADKPTEVVILSEKIGLPPDAAAEQIVERVYKLQESADKFEKMQNEADNLLRKAEEGEKAKAELAKVEAKLFMERAVNNGWIDKKDEQFFTDMFAIDPEKVKKHVESNRFRSFLNRAQALKSDDATPVNAVKEVEARVAAIRKADDKISVAQAQEKLFREEPALYDAYRKAVSAGGGDE